MLRKFNQKECEECKVKYIPNSSQQKYCVDCGFIKRKEYKKEYQKEYNKTDKHKEYQKEYNKTDKYKEYKKTDKWKEYIKRYKGNNIMNVNGERYNLGTCSDELKPIIKALINIRKAKLIIKQGVTK